MPVSSPCNSIWEVRCAAVVGVSKVAHARAETVGPVLNLLQDSEDSVRRAVLTALPRLAGHFHEVPADFERRFV